MEKSSETGKPVPVRLALVLCPPLWATLPPAGIAYLAESAERAGHEVSVFDLNVTIYNLTTPRYRKDWTVNARYLGEEFCGWCFREFRAVIDDLISSIVKQKIQYAGFSLFKSNRNFTSALIRRLRTEQPGVKIILGGPEVFALKAGDELETIPADYYVIGEGEKPLLEILAGSPERVYEFRQQAVPDFFPQYRAFDLARYPGRGRLPVVASRGCINSCAFCAERLLFKGYRWRRAEEVFTEISRHYRQHGVQHFVFYDSLFNGNLQNLEKILELLLAARLPVTWEAQVYIRDDMTAELLSAMKKSGCVNLFIGLESGSDTVLKMMNKRFTAGRAAFFLQQLFDAGLHYEISLILNYPGEGEAEFLETVEFIRQHRHLIKKIAQVNAFRPYPGTAIVPVPGYHPGTGRGRIEKLLEVFKDEGIPYTASYIDNLV